MELVNPNNEAPSIVKKIDGKTEKFFPGEIADRVPVMFIVLACIYTLMFIPALFMVKDIKKDEVAVVNKVASNVTPGIDNRKSAVENDDDDDGKAINEKKLENEEFDSVKEENCEKQDGEVDREGNNEEIRVDAEPEEQVGYDNSKLELIEQEEKTTKKLAFKRIETFIVNLDLKIDMMTPFKTRQFYQIFFASLLTGTACMYAIASYKSIGIVLGYDDKFLTLVGSIGALFNGFSRPLWGLLFDKKSYKFTYGIICISQVILCTTFPSVKNEKAGFLLWICLLFATSGGIFTLFAPISVRIYNRVVGSQIYALFVVAMGTSSLAVYFIQTYAMAHLSSSTFYYILGGFSGASFISNLFFSEILNI